MAEHAKTRDALAAAHPTATHPVLEALDPYSVVGRQRRDVYFKTSTVNVDKGMCDDPTLRLGFVDSLGAIGAAKGTSTGAVTGTGAGTGATRKFPPEVPLAHSTAPIFADRVVYLASDLGLRKGLEASLKERIEEAGGRCWSWGVDGDAVTASSEGRSTDQWERRRAAERELRKANTVVTRTREGWEFWHVSLFGSPHPRSCNPLTLSPFHLFLSLVLSRCSAWQAYEEDKTIGNLAWLYHTLAASKLDSPLDRLLHYPRPAQPIPGFDRFEMTISNYTSSARDYVRTMIESMGATFTGSMSKSTTQVITARSVRLSLPFKPQPHLPLPHSL